MLKIVWTTRRRVAEPKMPHSISPGALLLAAQERDGTADLPMAA
jgi:hypothetical protein